VLCLFFKVFLEESKNLSSNEKLSSFAHRCLQLNYIVQSAQPQVFPEL